MCPRQLPPRGTAGVGMPGTEGRAVSSLRNPPARSLHEPTPPQPSYSSAALETLLVILSFTTVGHLLGKSGLWTPREAIWKQLSIGVGLIKALECTGFGHIESRFLAGEDEEGAANRPVGTMVLGEGVAEVWTS